MTQLVGFSEPGEHSVDIGTHDKVSRCKNTSSKWLHMWMDFNGNSDSLRSYCGKVLTKPDGFLPSNPADMFNYLFLIIRFRCL